MTRRANATPKGIKMQRIAPLILGNLLLVAVVLAIVAAGILAFGVSLLKSRLSSAADSMSACSGIVGNALLDSVKRAERYAGLVADACFLSDVPLRDELMQLQTLQNDNDVGFVSTDGAWVNTGALLAQETAAAFTDESGQQQGACLAVKTVSGGPALAFTAPVTVSGETVGTLYLIDADALSAGASLQRVYPEATGIYLLDGDNGAVSYIGDATPDGFDYTAVVKSGALFFGGVTQADAVRILRKGLLKAELHHLPDRAAGTVESAVRALKDNYLYVDVWYEYPLSVNGWRALTSTHLEYDAFSLQELLYILLFALFVALLPIVFSFTTTASHIVNNRRIQQALLFDPVTGGNNFDYFKKAAAKTLSRRRYAGSMPVFAAVDIDRYRVFSDVHGDDAAEQLLYDIYRYLSNGLRAGELVTRYGVDQYALLLLLSPGEDPVQRVSRMLAGIARLRRGEKISCTAGVCAVTDRKRPVEQMYRCASVAKDAARKGGVGSHVMPFDSAMRDALLNEQQIESLMEKALKNREFLVYLQPKYSVQDHVLSGAEALIRWDSPERGFLAPGAFIPLFEKNGFILRLDDYMLTEVCRIQREFMDSGRALVPISVNISRAHFADAGVAEHIRAIVDAFSVPYDMIELELTESAFFDDKEALLATVRLLRGYGFPVSMDDFGSGYSSLNSLKDLPLDVVKLDKDFFNATDDTERGVSLIRDTIALAKNLRLEVVAEGIETREQVAFLSNTACDLIQGFYFAKPMPVDDFVKLPRKYT